MNSSQFLGDVRKVYNFEFSIPYFKPKNGKTNFTIHCFLLTLLEKFLSLLIIFNILLTGFFFGFQWDLLLCCTHKSDDLLCDLYPEHDLTVCVSLTVNKTFHQKFKFFISSFCNKAFGNLIFVQKDFLDNTLNEIY